MKAISVILPVYNVERYIAKCLDSIIAQQFHDYELIVIDDCGTDNSLNICYEKLMKSNIDYKIVRNPSNCGLSSSRNIGVKCSSGRYIKFVDSDDWIDPLMLNILYDAANREDADIISCKASRFWEDSGTSSEIPNLKQGIYNSEEYLNLYLNGSVNAEAWGRLYKRGLFSSVEFPSKINNEDLLTLPYLIKQSNKIMQLESCLYYYVQRETKSSITDSRPTNPEGFLDMLSHFKAFDSHSQLTKANGKLYAYRNCMAVALACVFHSNNFSEAKQDLVHFVKFIDTADFFLLIRGLRSTTFSMVFLLKCSPLLFYKVHKFTWQLREKLS